MKNAISKERIDWQLIKLLARLRENYQIHMLTDQIQLDNGAGAWIDEVYRHFHTIFRSYEQGFRKPDPAAYNNLLIKLHSTKAPETVLFIDDAKMNIEAAEALGMHGLLYSFKNHDVLKQKCTELGVILPNDSRTER